MNEKWSVAQQMLDDGSSNADIQDHLKSVYGSGISTTKLAEWRSTSANRQRSARQSLMAEKKALIRECLLDGKSGYAAQQECKRRFSEGVGHETIQVVQKAIEAEARLLAADKAAEADVTAAPPTDDRAIVPVELPPEMLEADEPSSIDLLVMAVHGPNGTLNNFKAIQQWMSENNAESLSLTADGKLSVLARHEFNLGGSQ